MSKYGLNLRVKPSEQKKLPARPPLRPPAGFLDDDDDDIETEISRQASKNNANKDYEELHKKALEEDPSVFDYDGVYDDMKQKAVRVTAQERQERKPKYIQALIEKAKVREREHEIVYERKIAKERSKDDHLFEGKDKFVTSAYKRKLAEQSKWLEEERLRELREEREDITKKGDMSEFYFNLSKNVAFGAGEADLRKQEEKQKVEEKQREEERSRIIEKEKLQISERSPPSNKTGSDMFNESGGVVSRKHVTESTSQAEPVNVSSSQDEAAAGPIMEQPKLDHHKRAEDDVAAAKARFLARKRAKLLEEQI